MDRTPLFENRAAAGRELGRALMKYSGHPDVLVLGLARGGMPVASEVAKTLRCPLDVVVVRKLGVPGQPELAMGAIACGGIVKLNSEVLRDLDITDEQLQKAIDEEQEVLARRERAYRGVSSSLDPMLRTVILVDDGLATGTSMRAAVSAVKALGAQRVIVAVPVASREAFRALAHESDEVVCVLQPKGFSSVGEWYEDFRQTPDEEVLSVLSEPPVRDFRRGGDARHRAREVQPA